MDPYATLEIARQRQNDLLREAERARLAAAVPRRPSLRGAVGLSIVRIGARLAGDDAVVLTAALPLRR